MTGSTSHRTDRDRQARGGGGGLDIDFRVGDCENLADVETGSFDIVTSTCGVMFAPNQEATAAELARVARPGGRLAMVNWTPEGGVGELFQIMKPFQPPPPEGVKSPFEWGKRDRVEELLGEAYDLNIEEHVSMMRSPSGEDYWQLFVSSYGPTRTLAESLDDGRREELHARGSTSSRRTSASGTRSSTRVNTCSCWGRAASERSPQDGIRSTQGTAELRVGQRSLRGDLPHDRRRPPRRRRRAGAGRGEALAGHRVRNRGPGGARGGRGRRLRRDRLRRTVDRDRQAAGRRARPGHRLQRRRRPRTWRVSTTRASTSSPRPSSDVRARPRPGRRRVGPRDAARRPPGPGDVGARRRDRRDVQADGAVPAPSPRGRGSPLDWGRPEYVEGLLGDAFDLQIEERTSVFEQPSAEDYWTKFSPAFARARRCSRRSTTRGAPRCTTPSSAGSTTTSAHPAARLPTRASTC